MFWFDPHLCWQNPSSLFCLSPQNFFQTHLVAELTHVFVPRFFLHKSLLNSSPRSLGSVWNLNGVTTLGTKAKRPRRPTFGSSSFASPFSPAGSLRRPRTRGRCSKCRRVVCLGPFGDKHGGFQILVSLVMGRMNWVSDESGVVTENGNGDGGPWTKMGFQILNGKWCANGQ